MTPTHRADTALDDPPVRQRRKEARPQELLEAALTLFVEKGFAATRAEEVAQRAGVSKGTLYLYYPSKEELFKAVVRQNLGTHITAARALVQQFDGPSTELLRSLLRAWWQRVGCTPAAGIPKIIFSEVRNFPELAQFYAEEIIEPAHGLVCAAIRRGIDRGEFRPLAVDATAQVLIAPLIFLAVHQHSVGACPLQGCARIDPQGMLDAHLDLALHGLLARPPGAGAATASGREGSR